MRLLQTSALSIALAAFSLGLVLPASASAQSREDKKKAEQSSGPKISLSKGFQNGAVEAQKLVQASDFAGAKAKLDEITPLATKADDNYFLGSLLLQTGIGLKDEAAQRRGLETILASGMAPAAEAAKFHYFVGQFAFNAKEYPKAREHFAKAIEGNYGGPTTDVLMANSYFNEATTHVVNNQFNETGKALVLQGLPHLKSAIAKQEASGQPVDASWYNKGLTMAVVAKSPDAAEWTKLSLSKGGSAESWRLVLREFQTANQTMTRDENLDLMRLMAATKSLQGDYSYNEYAEAANRAGLPGEVKSLIDSGRASGQLKAGSLNEIYQVANASVAADRASLPASEKSAASAATGKPAANTANALMGYGDNAKAIQLYNLALQKGGVDADEVNTRLGIALARSGDKAGAAAAFAKVGGTGARKKIADLWAVWVSNAA